MATAIKNQFPTKREINTRRNKNCYTNLIYGLEANMKGSLARSKTTSRR